MDDSTPGPGTNVADVVARLSSQGVVGVTIGWVDNNGIVRSRSVPLAELPAAARRGVGVTAVFAVFDSHDAITFAHPGLSTPSGDVRLVPVLDDVASVVPLAGQPDLAWVPGRQLAADGGQWPYDQRAVLERQVARAAEAGFAVRAGFEIEMMLVREGEGLTAAHRGPAYSPNALRDVDEFVRQLFGDLDANGLAIGQLHAEYGESQVELSLAPLDPLAACDAQVLARQTIHAAARAHGLRASFAPVTTTEGAGNGWHLHTSIARDGRNALTGDGPHGLSPVGRGYLGGLLRELPGIVAVTAPSTGSLVRRRPGYWAGAFGVLGRREPRGGAPTGTRLAAARGRPHQRRAEGVRRLRQPLPRARGRGRSGTGRRGDDAPLPDPVQEDVGTWDDERREAAGIAPLATTHEAQRANLLGSELVRAVLGDDLLGAFVACRDADAAWAEERSADEVVESLRWQY